MAEREESALGGFAGAEATPASAGAARAEAAAASTPAEAAAASTRAEAARAEGAGAVAAQDEPAAASAALRHAGSLVPVRARNLTRDTLLATDVEYGTSFWARFMGLMGRAGLPAGHAMWLPDNGIHMFFMRFPIDAVFLGPRGADGGLDGGADGGLDGRNGDHEGHAGSMPILALHADLAPWRGIVPLVRGAAGLLELPAGTIRASRSEVGDRVSLG